MVDATLEEMEYRLVIEPLQFGNRLSISVQDCDHTIISSRSKVTARRTKIDFQYRIVNVVEGTLYCCVVSVPETNASTLQA